MEFLTTILSGVEGLTEEQKESIVSSFKTEFPKHAVPKEQYSKKVAELDDANKQFDAAKKSLEDLSANTEDSEKLKGELATLKQSFDDYKANTEKRETNRSKTDALVNMLTEGKMIPSAAKMYAQTYDLDKITLDASGKIVDKDLILNPLKETSKELFSTVTSDGNPPPDGGTPPDSSKMSDADYYASLKKE